MAVAPIPWWPDRPERLRVRHDDHSSSPNLSSTTEPRLGSRVRAWAWPVVVIVLMVLTSLALAFTVSVWLVPPYFILMVWILAPAQGPRDHVPAPLAPGSQLVSDDESLFEPSESEIGLRSQPEPVVAVSSPSEIAADLDGGNDPNPVAVKTKRGKGRGRKAKGGPIVESAAAAPATWIQVGPGKFVRVEGPSTDGHTEPVPTLSESEPTHPPASALQPASEDVAELVSQELAAEVSPEIENRSAVFDAPAAHDEFIEDEPITDNDAVSLSDAEALLRPSPEEPVLSEEELYSGEFAVEVSPEPEDCNANFDEPVACDESFQDEPLTDDAFSSSDAEALLCPSPEEVVLPEEELVPQELAAEFSPEIENRSAVFDAPAAHDEFIEDEPITADNDAVSSSDAEALLCPSPEEPVLSEEELYSREFAVEVSPEPEDCDANFDEPAACDESFQDELITDDALFSSDAEASLRPSPEEVVLSELDGSSENVLEEPVPRELAAEVSPELEDRSAIFDAPAARDESIQDESITVADVVGSSPDLEACPQRSPEEVVLSEPDRSPDFELQPDETYVDEGACQEALASHENEEVVAEVEEGFDDFAEARGESVPASSELADHEFGSVEPSGDQGIALDALDVDWTTELADPPFEAAGSVQSPSLRAIIAPPRSTDNAPFVSWRGVWPRVGPAVGRPSGARPSRRVVRSGLNARVSPGFRRRSRRGIGSYRLVCRTFPPRSPPARGTIPRFETGRGVRESD
ncbi:hypothetical protein V5E97_26005 [Singulisphaera sp. Ch08]|uniref:Uncharacterized protein n=1 Tax=Singulisphaera sp. Ch08 TaxID=3120278 RepID=A0AAU7C9J8_9BACT